MTGEPSADDDGVEVAGLSAAGRGRLWVTIHTVLVFLARLSGRDKRSQRSTSGRRNVEERVREFQAGYTR
jgi:hypothetical protein